MRKATIMPPTVYLLDNDRCGTYIGATTDVTRRLRQHNGELVGGSRQTAGRGPWRLALAITGFAQWKDALKFEFAWRRHCRRMVRSAGWRQRALLRLLARPRWSSTSPCVADVALKVHAHDDDARFFSYRLMKNDGGYAYL